MTVVIGGVGKLNLWAQTGGFFGCFDGEVRF